MAGRFAFGTCQRFVFGLFVLLGFALLGKPIRAQQQPLQTGALPAATDSTNTQAAIQRVKTGQFLLVDINAIAQTGAVEAIPVLKEQFAKSEDISTKRSIASALVRLGAKDDIYWNYLINQATLAIDSDAPFYLRFDEKGKMLPGEPPRQLVEWVAAHHSDMQVTIENEMYVYPAAIADLGITGDLRAAPLLRRALLSTNFVVQTEAARGLVTLGDSESIPLIIEACKRAPADTAAAIASPLVYFDDVTAQRAVDLYVPKELAIELRKARAAKVTPYGERPTPH